MLNGIIENVFSKRDFPLRKLASMDLHCFDTTIKLKSNRNWVRIHPFDFSLQFLYIYSYQIVGTMKKLFDSGIECKNSHELEMLLRKQNIEYYKVYDQLAKMTSEEHYDILETNNQFLPENDSEVSIIHYSMKIMQ